MLLLLFKMDNQNHALHLHAVDKVVRAVEITPLPDAPPAISGIINVFGSIVPVLNARRRFRLPEREVELSDHLIIAHTSRHTVALVVDISYGVFDYPEEEILPPGENPDLEHVSGVMKSADGIIFLHDIDRFLSPSEEKRLNDALRNG